MTHKEIKDLYRQFRQENGNKKPNRCIVEMHWEDEPERHLVDTIGIEPENYWFDHDDAAILFWVSTIPRLIDLMQPGNGSDFIVDEVLEFYKI